MKPKAALYSSLLWCSCWFVLNNADLIIKLIFVSYCLCYLTSELVLVNLIWHLYFFRLKSIDTHIILEKSSSVLFYLLKLEDAVRIVHIVLNPPDMIQDWEGKSWWTRKLCFRQHIRCSYGTFCFVQHNIDTRFILLFIKTPFWFLFTIYINLSWRNYIWKFWIPVILQAKEAGSTRFCMGAAWRDTIGRKTNFNQILEYVQEIR